LRRSLYSHTETYSHNAILQVGLTYSISVILMIYTVSRKKQAKLFLLSLRQTSTKSNNSYHIGGKLSKIIRGALIFHLT